MFMCKMCFNIKFIREREKTSYIGLLKKKKFIYAMK